MPADAHTLVEADIRQGYVRHRLYSFQVRSHYGGIQRGRNLFLIMLKHFVHIRTYGLYVQHTLGIRCGISKSYARGTLLIDQVRWSYVEYARATLEVRYS